MLAARLKKLFPKSPLPKGRSNSVTDMATPLPKVVIQFMANAATPDDHPFEKAIKHGMQHPVILEVSSVEIIREPAQMLIVRHALGPGEGMPGRILIGP